MTRFTLTLDAEQRRRLWQDVDEAIESYVEGVRTARVAPVLDPASLRSRLATWDFARPAPPEETLRFVIEGLWGHQVHTAHPRYFGLFNPAPASMGVAADALVAAFNPQLAAWSHNPLAVEIEQHLVRLLGMKFGYAADRVEGTFTSGGAEANHSALALALRRAFPETVSHGLRALPHQPVLYASRGSHHSLVKAARLCGLGSEALHVVEVDAAQRMLPAELSAQIEHDRRAGEAPFMVVATAGTTGAGAVDPIAPLAEIATEEGLWLHADAAWGGAAVLVPELAPLLDGIDRADSITFDAHKWLSVPMSAGLLLTCHPGSLERTFRVDAGYMPLDAAGLTVVDPYAHSMQWSRRFIGLKLFMSLAVAGWGGYEAVLRHQTAMGERLRAGLRAGGWQVVNDTPLPVVCFADSGPHGRTRRFVDELVADVVASGEAWISQVALEGAGPALRACITNHGTEPEDVDALVDLLARCRAAWLSRHAGNGG
jgi:glutamate/tyrosine decarboxylase-like PLP-dependent enzyme